MTSEVQEATAETMTEGTMAEDTIAGMTVGTTTEVTTAETTAGTTTKDTTEETAATTTGETATTADIVATTMAELLQEAPAPILQARAIGTTMAATAEAEANSETTPSLCVRTEEPTISLQDRAAHVRP